MISIYEELSRSCDYVLHLGLTEAGMGSKGIVASSTELGVLMKQCIGDTIRVSLTLNSAPRALKILETERQRSEDF